MNPTHNSTPPAAGQAAQRQIEILEMCIRDNMCRLREDWQTVESKQISRRNIAEYRAEIARLTEGRQHA